MPYKDLERKRQWEREHREQRNARRRKSIYGRSADPSGVAAPLPDSNSGPVALTSMNIAIGAMMGLAFFVATFIILWHFWHFGVSAADPLATA